ncbi:hypothetical protein [Larkinella harenae]
MKKIGLLLLVLASFSSCKDQEANPSISGTFTGPATVEDKVGIASYSNAEVTVEQIGSAEVQVSGRGFETFVVENVNRNGSSYYSAGDGTNEFRYSGSSTPNTLLIDWTADVKGKVQTVRFGGNKKK